MDIVERLLMREEIDSLELDLARARDAGDAEQVNALSVRIAQLEMAVTTARRSGAHLPFSSRFSRHALSAHENNRPKRVSAEH